MLIKIKKSNQIIISLKSFSFNILKYYLAAFFSLIKSKKYSFKLQPTKYKLLTVLRSPHKYKKAQEHFQLKIFKANLIIYNVDMSELILFLTNKPKGVSMKIKIRQTKVKE